MRPWTAAATRAALLTLACSFAGACTGDTDDRDSATVVQSLVPIEAQPGTGALRLVRGHTFRLDLRGAGPRPARPGQAAEPAPSSSVPRVATVSPDGLITALTVGTTIITVPGGERGARTTAIPVRVVTPGQAIKETMGEVCPNVPSVFLAAETPAVSDSVATIHEYHDCQRLIVGRRYEALVGIFAHENVAKYPAWHHWDDGRLAAIIVNFDVKDEKKPYAPLGLARGTNCLVLKADSAHRWRAAVVSLNDAPIAADTSSDPRRFGRCDDTMNWSRLPPTARQLVVRRQRGVDMKGDSLAPPVARWDWDSVHRINYIGVRCDSMTWCEIGPDSFETSRQIRLRDLAGPPVPPNPDAYVLKGYYDTQLLADSTGAVPSTVFGTIFPGDDGKRRDDMKAPKPLYEVARLQFRETAMTQSRDYRRYMRNYTRRPAVPRLERKWTTSYRMERRLTLDPRKQYNGRFGPDTLDDNGVLMTPHTGILHKGPPVVRWRWHALDERTWTYCDPDGCCENVKVLLP